MPSFRISIHAPAKGATVYAQQRSSLAIFQSTLPRRERRQRVMQPLHDRPISIHTPAKGATLYSLLDGFQNGISIHTPAKGATCGSRYHCRRDTISIHAPVKGATTRPRLPGLPSSYFNPHSREGSDRWHRCPCPLLQVFQSTLP